MKPLLVSTLTLALAMTAPAFAKTTPAAERPVDLVICLDTSGSMQGLIEAAKQKLWDIVNELGRAQPTPHLRVGLYVFGTPSYGAETGYVRKLIDLTDDLDAVYAQLTPLRTSGGEEYVARVTRAALLEQPWTPGHDALKIIVVAGNEAATQDPEYRTLEICKQAIARGIIVNTIYCGAASSSDAAGWRDAARAADGQFANIDHENGTVVINTPFDDQLAELSRAINTTYVAYGARAAEGVARQTAADASSLAAAPAVAASRAVAKGSRQYRNTGWDLVDARGQADFKLEAVPDAELPAELRALTLAERAAHLDAMAAKRAAIQQAITALNAQREAHIRAQLSQGGQPTDKAFDTAMLTAIRAQAQRKQFRFE